MSLLINIDEKEYVEYCTSILAKIHGCHSFSTESDWNKNTLIGIIEAGDLFKTAVLQYYTSNKDINAKKEIFGWVLNYLTSDIVKVADDLELECIEKVHKIAYQHWDITPS